MIADAIAHAIDPPLLFSLQQQVEELEGNRGGNPGLSAGSCGSGQGPRGWSKGPRGFGRKGTSGSSKKVKIGGDGELVSSPPSISGVIRGGLTSRVFLPEYNHCPLTRVKCGAEKIELGYRTNPHANWS